MRARVTLNRHHKEDTDMGKYFIAWLLGVPAVVLVIIYLIAN